ncbi:MAG: hypothetical protein DWQ02_19080 [Bacteroidetes bacterium]|nr:MAG: hypothetical protein DWQ02_19080 [Bacteroidota bacterium]
MFKAPFSILFRSITYSGAFILSLITVVFAQPTIPTGVAGLGYDSHVELKWNQTSDPSVSGFRIYKKVLPDGTFEQIGYVTASKPEYIDFTGRVDLDLEYVVRSLDFVGEESEDSDVVSVSTFEMTDEELLTMVQEYTFRYFWDFAHPVSGMARERSTTSIVTSGGSGFGVMAIVVGVERGFITYEEGLERMLKIVEFLETADRFHGAWPHWMNGGNGNTIPFSEFDNGGDIVETSFMLQGLLTARQYFNGNSEDETILFNKITQLWEEMDWRWYRKQTQQILYWHWSPNYGWQMNFQIRGFNEAQIVYLLAIASPTNFVPPSLYHDGWAGGNYTNNNTFYGFPVEVGPTSGGPLFFAHYSYLGFDPRGIKDEYTNYFNKNYFHTMMNRAYCIDNPENHEGYSDVCWGLTASDNPWGYLAHEPTAARDNGTITPTAALSSMPYTPQLSIQALKHFYRDHGADLWGKYGFKDAFNLDEDWFASSYLAIDQGPIICMIENYRSGILWDMFMSNEEIAPALEAIGFEPDSTMVGLETLGAETIDMTISPIPVVGLASLQFNLEQKERLSISMYNVSGLLVKDFYVNQDFMPGRNELTLDFEKDAQGLYFVVVQSDTWRTTMPVYVE